MIHHHGQYQAQGYSWRIEVHLAAPGWFGGVVWLTTLGASGDHLSALYAHDHRQVPRSCRYDTID